MSRSASVMIRIWCGAVAGRRAASCTSARISETLIDRPSGTTSRTSGWVPLSTVWQEAQWPQPLSGHWSAALDQNVKPEIAVEAMMTVLQRG